MTVRVVGVCWDPCDSCWWDVKRVGVECRWCVMPLRMVHLGAHAATLDCTAQVEVPVVAGS